MNENNISRTIITAHANADFDAICSMVAASFLYPDAVLIHPFSQDKNLSHPFVLNVLSQFPFESLKNIDLKNISTVVICDTKQKHRVAHIDALFELPNIILHGYDHHPISENDLTFDVLYQEEIGSTTSIICALLKEKNISLTPDIASFIALGIYEDTGSFTFNTTTKKDFSATSWLLENGLDVSKINKVINRSLAAEQVALLAKLLENISYYNIKNLRIAVAKISATEFIANFADLAQELMNLSAADGLFLLGAMEDKIHIIARSKSPHLQVNAICKVFGGGGHAQAASASVKNQTFEEVIQSLIPLFHSHIESFGSIASIMTKPVISIDSSKNIGDAHTLMERFRLKALPVTDTAESSVCIGIINFKVAVLALHHNLAREPVVSYMQDDFAAVTEEDDIFTALSLVLEKQQKLIPVLKNGLLFAVVSKTDLIKLFIQENAKISEKKIDKKKQKNITPLLQHKLAPETFLLLNTMSTIADESLISCYVVGGFVRDLLLDAKENKDIDLVVEGDAIEFARTVQKKLGGKVYPHENFQTALLILPDGLRIDIAAARLEYYESPAALPIVENSSIKRDLSRRDFSINSLAVSLNQSTFGSLFDFFDAQNDIKLKQIRVLHSLSFIEDPTRILRAVRFTGRYQFQIHPQTLRLIQNSLKLSVFSHVAGKRLFHELELICQEKTPAESFVLLNELRIFENIHPLFVLKNNSFDLFFELQKILSWYNLLYAKEKPSLWIVYFLCFPLKEKELREIFARLEILSKFENIFFTNYYNVKKIVQLFVNWFAQKRPLSEIFVHFEKVDIETLLVLMAKCKKQDMTKIISHYINVLRHLKPEITGNDLIQLGLPQGKTHKVILDVLTLAIVDEQIITFDEQKELAEKLIERYKKQGNS